MSSFYSGPSGQIVHCQVCGEMLRGQAAICPNQGTHNTDAMQERLRILEAKADVCDALMQDYDSLAAKLRRWPSLFKLNDAIDRLRELQETGK